MNSIPEGHLEINSSGAINKTEGTFVKICKLIDFCVELTHWGRVTQIYVSIFTIIGSDIGLPPIRRQTIIWTNAVILLIRTLIRNKFQWNLNPNSYIFKQENAFENVVMWTSFKDPLI